MDNHQTNAPVYDNRGFQHEDGRPPPYSPQQGIYPAIPQDAPSYSPVAPTLINTHYPVTTATPQRTRRSKGRRTCPWKYILCASMCLLLILAVLGVLLWYFLYYQCALGKSCRRGGQCLSSSQWCDGYTDCDDGEDEAYCFRLYGTNSILQSYSSEHQAWFPMCAEDWDDSTGGATCVRMGYQRKDYVSFSRVSPGSMASLGYMKLKPGSDHGLQLTYSKSCSVGAVKLKCIECGKSSASPSSRIVGGTEAVNGAWPWQVSLQVFNRHICGGSIIDPYWIVSAAHCFQTASDPYMWRVKSGGVNVHELSFVNPVEKIISHEDFDTETNDNDIALLKLNRPLTFGETVRPVCLPNVGLDISAERQAWITGWGALRSGGDSPDILNQAQVKIYSRETCNSPEVLSGRIKESMICAGKLSGGVDTCQGDSGGPLVVKEENLWWLAGDTSWGIGCALKNKPGVYGNVTYFLNWIHEQMQAD